MPYDIYSDIAIFTNTTSGAAQLRDITLTIEADPGEINVTDSIADPIDLDMPFGEVIIGLPRTEHVTISNTDPTYGLIISDILLNNWSVITTEGPQLQIELPAVKGGSVESDAYVPDFIQE